MQQLIDGFPDFYLALLSQTRKTTHQPSVLPTHANDVHLAGLIRSLHDRGATELALQYVEQALLFMPESHQLGCLIFELAAVSERCSLLLLDWSRLTTECSDNGLVIAAYAQYLKKLHRVQEAHAAYAVALRLGVDYKPVLKHYMLFLLQNGLYPDLKILLEHYIATFKTIDLTYYLGSARAYLGMHNTPKALVYIKNGLRDYPYNPDLLVCLAEAQLQSHDRAAALSTMQMALDELAQTDEVHLQSILSYSETEFLELEMEIHAHSGQWHEAMSKAARLHDLLPQKSKYQAAIEALYRLIHCSQQESAGFTGVVDLLAMYYADKWSAITCS